MEDEDYCTGCGEPTANPVDEYGHRFCNRECEQGYNERAAERAYRRYSEAKAPTGLQEQYVAAWFEKQKLR